MPKLILFAAMVGAGLTIAAAAQAHCDAMRGELPQDGSLISSTHSHLEGELS